MRGGKRRDAPNPQFIVVIRGSLSITVRLLFRSAGKWFPRGDKQGYHNSLEQCKVLEYDQRTSPWKQSVKFAPQAVLKRVNAMVNRNEASALTSAQLMQGHEAGNQEATTELFNRYLDQLIRLARNRLAPKLARRIDPEDVVQSAYRSFFTAVGERRFVLERSGDLWRLLAGITLNKLYRQVERNTAKKRDVSKERGLTAEDSLNIGPKILSREPSPSEAVALADEIQLVMRNFEPLHREMLELRLQGYLVEEIASQTKRTQRTVLRVLGRFKQMLRDRAAAAITSA